MPQPFEPTRSRACRPAARASPSCRCTTSACRARATGASSGGGRAATRRARRPTSASARSPARRGPARCTSARCAGRDRAGARPRRDAAAHGHAHAHAAARAADAPGSGGRRDRRGGGEPADARAAGAASPRSRPREARPSRARPGDARRDHRHHRQGGARARRRRARRDPAARPRRPRPWRRCSRARARSPTRAHARVRRRRARNCYRSPTAAGCPTGIATGTSANNAAACESARGREVSARRARVGRARCLSRGTLTAPLRRLEVRIIRPRVDEQVVRHFGLDVPRQPAGARARARSARAAGRARHTKISCAACGARRVLAGRSQESPRPWWIGRRRGGRAAHARVASARARVQSRAPGSSTPLARLARGLCRAVRVELGLELGHVGVHLLELRIPVLPHLSSGGLSVARAR